MKRCSIFALVAVLLAGQIVANADSLHKVWEVDVRKWLPNSDRDQRFLIEGLFFSPNGQELAVTLLYEDRLLVLHVARPYDRPSEFVPNRTFTGSPAGLRWSPDGQFIALGDVVTNVSDGSVCKPKSSNGLITLDNVFISNSRTISEGLRPSRDRVRESGFTFFDPHCEEQGKWDVPERWDIDDVSDNRGLLAVRRSDEKGQPSESLIVDPSARKVLRRWPWSKGSGALFADSGKAICAGSNVGLGENRPVTCWDVDTGEKVSETPAAAWGRPVATAAQGSRIIVDEMQPIKTRFYDYVIALVRMVQPATRRLVWDFRKGQELVSWRAEFQSTTKLAESQISEPFNVAITPDGQYIAEGGNGIIRLYKIEP
jgi:hypothetical protein